MCRNINTTSKQPGTLTLNHARTQHHHSKISRWTNKKKTEEEEPHRINEDCYGVSHKGHSNKKSCI